MDPLFEIEEDFVFKLSPNDNKKRKLSSLEIGYILSVITPNKMIPQATAVNITRNIKDKLRLDLEKVMVYPCVIDKLRSEIEQKYEQSKITSGENVGIMAAQSFGQFYTQSTLNTFHTAGLSVKAVVSGVVRFEEILNTTSNPKSVVCSVKFKSDNSSIYTLREKIKSSIVYFDVGKIASEISFATKSIEPDWYSGFELLYNNRFREYTHFALIKLNRKLLYEYLIKIEDIASKIEEAYSDFICVFSPLNIGEIHVYIDISAISMPEEKLCYVNADNMYEVYIEEVVIPNLEKIYISGIKWVENAFYTQEKDGWYIETEGGDFSEVLAHPDIDTENTMTNNIWDIYHTLGVEAVRQAIVDELVAIMPSISILHSKFLADYMTHTGTLISISRYTLRSEGSGPLSKASFEETIDNLINAGITGEIENSASVSTSIICGKLGSFGTGVMDCKLDITKFGIMSTNVRENVNK